MARRALPDPCVAESPELCLACGYALRGLAAPGMCPECGLPFEAHPLVVAGIPNRSAGGSGARRAMWAAVFVVFFVHLYTWPFQVFLLRWEVPLIVLALLIGAFVALLMTGPRERRGVERFHLTRAGIARLPLDPAPGSRPDTRLVRWEGANVVELRRISPVWRRVRIGRAAGGRLERVVFDAGIRCRDEDAEMVERMIRESLRGTARSAAAPGTDEPVRRPI